jgi:hypothetical protein
MRVTLTLTSVVMALAAAIAAVILVANAPIG